MNRLLPSLGQHFRPRLQSVFLVLMCAFGPSCPAAAASLPPTGLMVDLLREPARAALTNPAPRFSWIVNDTEANAHQYAFQILVARNLDELEADQGTMWDSGLPPPDLWAPEARSTAVPYAGRSLEDASSYAWKVRTWSAAEKPGPWSEPQIFHTGDLSVEAQTDAAPLTTTSVEPASVVRQAKGRFFIDFGRAAFGTVELTVDSPDARVLRVHLGEVAASAHSIDRKPGGSRRYQSISLPINVGRHSYRLEIPSDERNTRNFAIPMPSEVFEVYPFRYVEVDNHPGTLLRENIRQVTVHYPFDDGAAVFRSSNTVLNDVWALCHYTMKATSFCGYYVDGDRERIPYEADAYINQLGHYGCDREYAMARRTHEHLITHPTWPTEWILDSVLMAWYDYLYTGNPDSLRRHYRNLKAKSLVALARDDGLIELSAMNDAVMKSIHFTGESLEMFPDGVRNIVDWPPTERDHFDFQPVNAVVNALHYEAVRLMAQIATAVGENDDAAFFAEREERLKASFVDTFIDSQSGWVLDGEGSEHASLHANMFALAFNLVPEANRPAVLALLRRKGMACSVYGAQFLLEAAYNGGDGALGLSLLTATGERSWAHMIYDVGSTVATEAWDNRLKPNQDWNHAWGAAPANIIPRYLMGVRPLKPGFEEILIQPQPGGLTWAESTIPTVRGPVSVRFHQSGEGDFRLETETPANTTVRVILKAPDGTDLRATVDGRSVFPRRQGDLLVFDGIGSGRHSIELHP